MAASVRTGTIINEGDGTTKYGRDRRMGAASRNTGEQRDYAAPSSKHERHATGEMSSRSTSASSRRQAAHVASSSSSSTSSVLEVIASTGSTAPERSARPYALAEEETPSRRGASPGLGLHWFSYFPGSLSVHRAVGFPAITLHRDGLPLRGF